MNLFGLFLQVLSAFFGVLALAVLFRVPRRYLFFSGLAGALGWFVDLVMTHYTENDMLSVFGAAVVVSVISQLFARAFKAPVTVFLVTGILPLVPGIGMYRMVFFLLRGDNATASHYFSYTLQMAGMIALAIFVVDSVFKIIYRKKK